MSPSPAPIPALSADPFAGATLFVDPDSEAAAQARAWRASRPADAALMDRIAAQPQADWFGDWNTDVRGDVSSRVAQIDRAGALPVFVAYDIPERDCGGYSAGGAPSGDAYRAWIDGMAQGLGSSRAAVILEPDALADLDCLSAQDQATRVALLSYAVRTLSASGRVAVYVDAGNSSWQPAAVMASRLRQVGLTGARGFALNVSSFRTTAESTAYGHAISAALGGNVPFVIDTSRNGNGPTADDQWCNPPGRALGYAPTTQTGDPLVDAYLWIKTPGESDGACNGGPAAGEWWPEYALGLARGAT